MNMSFVLYPNGFRGFLGRQVERMVCVRRFLGSREAPCFLNYLRQQVRCNIFALNMPLPKLFLLNFDFSVTSGATVTKEIKETQAKTSQYEQDIDKKPKALDASLKDTFMIEKKVLIAEWLQDTQKVLSFEDCSTLERPPNEEEQPYLPEPPTREQDSFGPFKWSGIVIISFSKGNKFFIGILHVVATVVVFFISSVFQLSKITYNTACRLGDNFHIMSPKLTDHRDRAKVDNQ